MNLSIINEERSSVFTIEGNDNQFAAHSLEFVQEKQNKSVQSLEKQAMAQENEDK